MFTQWRLFLIFANVLIASCSVKRTVMFSGPSGLVKNRIACAVTYADPVYLAIRINDVTGACEGLTWDTWGSSRSYDTGYTYIEKKKTKEVFEPPTMILGSTNWLIPGTFGNGGRIDIHFTPTPESDSYRIRIMDITDIEFNVYDGIPERLMVSIEFTRGADVAFKTWTPEQWWINRHSESAFTFTEDVKAKISIVPDATNFAVYFDDKLVVSYPFPTNCNPNDVKQILFNMDPSTGFKINKIKFIGI